MATDLESLLEPLPEQHRRALRWFADRAGQEHGWPGALDDETLLATKAKGIYKPKWTDYALSIRQTLGGPYPDKDPVVRADGTWTYDYFQEGENPGDRDAAPTNKGLLSCQVDRVPVGVMRQTQRKPKKVLYRILGVALVDRWEAGYFRLEGFNAHGQATPDSRPAAQGGAVPAFDPTNLEDGRKRTLQAITQRQGQGPFRRGLLQAYGGRCAITGCEVEQALEAAHIVPYRGKHTNALNNGLLLRADIHTLFDLGLLAIDEDEKVVVLADSLRTGTYAELHGRPLAKPRTSEALPNRMALQQHRKDVANLPPYEGSK